MGWKFNDRTLGCLKAAGWHAGRSVDTAEFKRRLEAEGCIFFPVVEKFMSEFGGLLMCHSNHCLPDVDDHFLIDPLISIDDFDTLWVTEEYSRRIDTPLCVIGQAYRGYMVLSMDNEGSVYAGYDETLHKVACSGEEAIEKLCCGYEPKDLIP